MTHTILERHKNWRDELIYTLRMDNVPGDRIGDILLEVDTHVRETGEDPVEAFGPAKAYAKERATAARNPGEPGEARFDVSLIGIGIGSFVGAGLFASGAISIGRDENAFWNVPGWLALIVGAVILGLILLRLPFDIVRHPRTGAPLLGDATRVRWIAAVTPLALGLALYVLGKSLG